MFIACQEGHLEIVQWLHTHGAARNVTQQHNNGTNRLTILTEVYPLRVCDATLLLHVLAVIIGPVPETKGVCEFIMWSRFWWLVVVVVVGGRWLAVDWLPGAHLAEEHHGSKEDDDEDEEEEEKLERLQRVDDHADEHLHALVVFAHLEDSEDAHKPHHTEHGHA